MRLTFLVRCISVLQTASCCKCASCAFHTFSSFLSLSVGITFTVRDIKLFQVAGF